MIGMTGESDNTNADLLVDPVMLHWVITPKIRYSLYARRVK